MIDQSSKRSTSFFNRLRRGALIGFAAGLALILSTPLIRQSVGLEESVFVLALFLSGFLLMMASAFALTFFMLGHDLIEWKRKRWRYSLRALLVGMTVLAIVLGLAAAMIRVSN